mmetsp:Transcript_54412/g.80749  ORF Transcript_54412/g.80749 Transcript_54412/m.80749 type:complete len:227 (+) Transcript_54412:3518-4198(+)
MELRREVGPRLVRNTLVRTIVRIREQRLPPGFHIRGINHVSMILGRDVAFLRLVIEHRLILPTVSEREFLAFSTGGKAHELISHTDTVNWLHFVIWAGHDLFEFGNGRGAHGWISRSVAQKQTVVVGHFGRKLIIPRYHRQFHSTFHQKTDDVVLHTAIHRKHLNWVPFPVHSGFRHTHLAYQMPFIGIFHLAEIRCRSSQIHLDATQQGTLFSNLLRKHTGIDIA